MIDIISSITSDTSKQYNNSMSKLRLAIDYHNGENNKRWLHEFSRRVLNWVCSLTYMRIILRWERNRAYWCSTEVHHFIMIKALQYEVRVNLFYNLLLITSFKHILSPIRYYQSPQRTVPIFSPVLHNFKYQTSYHSWFL